MEKICDHCKKFIITGNRSIETLWDDVAFSQTLPDDSNYEEYVSLFNRLVSFQSLAKKSFPVSAWSRIHGKDAPPTAVAGYTAMSNSDFEECLKIPHNAAKILFVPLLYFNVDQAGLLIKHHFFHVLFSNDYGSGKFQIVLLLS